MWTNYVVNVYTLKMYYIERHLLKMKMVIVHEVILSK